MAELEWGEVFIGRRTIPARSAWWSAAFPSKTRPRSLYAGLGFGRQSANVLGNTKAT